MIALRMLRKALRSSLPAGNKIALVCVAGGLAGASCTVHEVDHQPKAPVAGLPAQYLQAEEGQLGDGRWWRTFQNPELEQLIESSLAQNLELHQAWARLAQAEAIAVQAGSGLVPTVGLQAGASEQRSLFQGQASTTAQYSASVPASYELDVWGKIRSGQSAAEQDVLAARDEVEAGAMTLAANIAEQWLAVVEQQAVRKLLIAQRRTNETFLELVELRFEQGDAIASDVLQQRQLLSSIDSRLAELDSAEAVAWNQISVLTAQSPQALKARGRTAELPDIPGLPSTGLPSQLLERRPDVRAARRRVIAADYRIGVAIADRYPSFAISGSVGLQAMDLADIFKDFVWSLGGSAAVNLIDGGRRAAEVDRTEAVLEERIAGYGLALLRALSEVEGALVQEREQVVSISFLSQQVESATLSLEVARDRYRQGLIDYLVVLNALQSLHQAEQSLLGAKRRRLSQRIQLHRALGGTWTRELERPKRLRRDDDEEDPDETAGDPSLPIAPSKSSKEQTG